MHVRVVFFDSLTVLQSLNTTTTTHNNTGTQRTQPDTTKTFSRTTMDSSEFKFQEFKQNDFDSCRRFLQRSYIFFLTSSSRFRNIHKLDTDTDESLSAMEASSKLSSSSLVSTKRCSILLGM